MKIKNHRLLNDDDTVVPFKQSPNIGGSVQHPPLPGSPPIKVRKT